VANGNSNQAGQSRRILTLPPWRRIAFYQYRLKSSQAAKIFPAPGLPGRSECRWKQSLGLPCARRPFGTAAAWKAARRFGCGFAALRCVADLQSAGRLASQRLSPCLALADCKSAVQQIENLRHGPRSSASGVRLQCQDAPDQSRATVGIEKPPASPLIRLISGNF
jgi:hypothetical protein